MGGKQSSNNPRTRSYSSADSTPNGAISGTSSGAGGLGLVSGPSSSGAQRARARSIGAFGTSNQGINIPSLMAAAGAHGGSPDSGDSSSQGDSPFFSHGYMQAHSLPLHLLSFHGIKCPVCSKFVPPDDIECHLVMCLTKPRITYNEDVLKEDKGECVICLEDLTQGDTIARLPCLCIYHKSCIDAWFEINRSCPEHPID